MRSLSVRLVLSFLVFLCAPIVWAHDVTLTGTQSFSSLDGSGSDHDGTANGVFTVNDGNLVVAGVVNCNDDGPGGNSACAIAFAVSGNLSVNAGGALYAENRTGAGNGGAIALTVGGNLVLSGNAIISSASTSNSANANGGAINATVAGAVSVGAGSTIDSGTPGGTAGSIALAAGGVVAIDGNVLAGPSRGVAATRLTGVVLTGGGGNQNGGRISVTSTAFAEPAVLVGPAANVVSQGENTVGSVTLDGCGVEVRGLVASVARASSSMVTIRSGKSAVIDGRDLAAAGLRMGRVRADSTAGTAVANRVDVFVADSAAVYGPASGLYAVTSNTGSNDPKGEGGSVRLIALGGTATAAGNAIDAGGSNAGNGGGSIAIDSASDAVLTTASLRAAGDSASNNNNRDGGSINVRSYSGNVIWTNGTGDVRPVGSASSIPLADQGSIVLTACGTVNTTGSSFPVNGTATSVHPQTQTGVCSPAAPSLPAGTPVLVTCNTPPVANDAAATTNEDTAVTIVLSGTDADGDSLTFSIVSGPANGVLGPIVSTGPTTATVNYSPNLNFNGADVFVYQANDGNGGTDNGTVSITVNAVNDAPSFLAGPTVTVLEDAGAQTYANWATAISPGPADESGQTVSFTVNNDNPALFSVQPAVSSTGTLTFTATANAYGSANITITAQDNGGTLNGVNDNSASQTSSVTITAVNDEPSFAGGPNQNANEDSGPQTVAGWATAIDAGPNEGSQTVSFVTSNDNPGLFSAQPSVSSNGTLTYTSVANANGSATVTIYAQDDGGTANGGDDTSASQTFTITVTAVNDAPSFTSGGNVTVNEDSGAYSAAWATVISAGPADENGQTVNFSTSNNNAALFAVAPAVSSTGVLTFTLNANAFGSATVTVSLSDNGGTANGGDDTSAAQTFTITVNNVNDEPTFTAGGNVTRSEDSGAYSAAWATSVSAGPNEGSQTVTFNVSNDNSALFSVQPSISASGVLSFTTATNAFGAATVSVTLTDNGGTANGGDDTSSTVTFTITIDPVNDAPSFTGGGNVSVGEDSGPYSAAWAAGISAGPANESSQTVSFAASNNNNALFSVQPSVSSAGVLSFTPNANATGTATVTVYAQDNGGTANGGIDVSASQTFTISVTGVNDPPSFTPGANQTSNEDAGPQTVVGWATGISSGSGESDTVTFFTSNDNAALFSAQPSVAPDGTLTYTASPNGNGVAAVTIYAKDNGGTANGGNDTSASYTFTITVVAVNDAPSFTGGGDVSVPEDSAPYSATWATAISAGPADEAGQTVSFSVSNNNNGLFSTQPSISPGGVLSFVLNVNVSGSATVTVTLSDNGGTGNGGADTSASQTFTINVAPVNDAPSFVGGGDVTVNEDSGPYAAPWASSISAGPNETQVVSFSTSNNNNALFVVQPSISATGVLSFTPALNAFGTATVTVTLSDNGGTANGGVDTSAAQTFVINVTAVNDAPTASNDSWQTLGNTELRVDMVAGVTPSVIDTTPSGNGVRDNDTDPEGDPSVVTGVAGCGDTSAPFDCTLGGGAKVTMLANGSFSYTPAPGATSGSFQYTVTDVPAFGAPQSATATVTITISDMIWYVNGAAAGGNGTSSAPFTNFTSLNGVGDVDGVGHTIFVHTSAVAGSIDLEAGQFLWGQGIGLSKPYNLNGNGSPTVLVAPGIKPTISSTIDVVTIAGVPDVEVAGLTLFSTGGSGIEVTATAVSGSGISSRIAGNSGGSAATATSTPARALIYDNVISGAGAAGIDINAESFPSSIVTINNTSITSSGNGLDVRATGGCHVSFANGTITSSGGSGMVMDGSGGNLTVSGLSSVTVHGNTAGDGISITAARFDAVAGGSFDVVNAGTITVGASGNPVGGAGVILSNVSGDLNIGHWQVYASTSGVIVSGSGLHTGSAGMRLSNSSGVISASAGVGLSVTDSTIASGNLNFTSVSSTGGPNGILLSNTGTIGGLTVTGNGSTAGSGGTIQNTSSDSVRLVDARNVSLSFMNITNAASSVTNGVGCTLNNATACESAVDMLNASNVTLNNVVIDHNGGGQIGISGVNTNGLTVTDTQILEVGNANDESGVLLQDTSGAVLFEDVLIDNPEEYGLRLYNTGGTLAMTLRRVTVQNNIGAFGEAGASFRIEGGSATVHIDDSDFLNTDGAAVDGQAAGATGAVLNMTITGSTMNENRALPHGINFVTSGTATGRLTADGNTLTGCAVATNCSQGIDLDAAGSSTLDARITNNVLTSTGIGSGIEFIANDNAIGRAEIRDNSVTVNANRLGMNFLARSVAVPGATGQLHLTIEGNVVNGINSAVAPGMAFQAGASTGVHANTVCADVNALTGSGGNIVNGTPGPGVFAYTLRQRTGTTFRLAGFTGTGTVDTSVEAHVQSNNSGGTLSGAAEVFAASGSTIVNYTSGACQSPTAAPLP